MRQRAGKKVKDSSHSVSRPTAITNLQGSSTACVTGASTEEEAQMAQAWKAKRIEYRDTGLLPIQAAVKANQKEEGLRLLKEKVAPLYEEMRAFMNKLIQIQRDEAEKLYKAAVVTDEYSKTVSVLAMVEQMAAAASSLRSQAREQVEIVSTFKFDSDNENAAHGMLKLTQHHPVGWLDISTLTAGRRVIHILTRSRSQEILPTWF